MSIPLLFAKRGFHPRQLFSALQGAWLEPTPGCIWQENTGVTPTTTGGQTIGLLLDQSKGVVLGPELVTNGDFSNGTTGWTVGGGNGTIAVVGGELQLTAGTNGIAVNGSFSSVAGSRYLVSFSGRKGTYTGTFQAGTATGPGFAPDLSSVEILDDTQRNYSLVTTALSATTYLVFRFASIQNTKTGYVDKISVRQILGNHASQSTAANRPTYQLDSNNLPLARHDTTDSLVVSLPSINVRRNFSAPSYGSFGASNIHSVSAKFSETVNYGLCTLCSDPTILLSNSGSLGLRFGPATATTNARIPAFTGNATVSMYIRLVSGSLPATNTLVLLLRGSTSGSATLSLNSVVTSDWKRISLTGAFAVSDGTVGWYLETQGTGTFAVEITGYQLELGSVATDYQKITDWTSEAYSSSGSVYFATPQGMSALHNQSMATTYTLPALSTDIYSWVVVPQRLSTVLEGRLERYMLRKAGLAVPDYLTDDFGETITDDIGDPILAG